VTAGEDGDPRPVFELFDTTLAEAVPHALGVWATVPAAARGSGAIDPRSATVADAPRWRANLPADPRLASVHLAGGEAGLAAAERALARAEDRIAAVVRAQTTGPAFDVSAGVPPAQPEAELLALVSEIQQGGPAISFGVGEGLAGGWEEATRRFQAFVDRLVHVVAREAWVETRIEGQLLGQTAVGWTGDLDTVWGGSPGPAQLALHRRALALALASRQTLLRTFVVAARGAVTLSVLLTAPGGALLALPAAWKFVDRVVAELERHEERPGQDSPPGRAWLR
jgi:hypothetical protein